MSKTHDYLPPNEDRDALNLLPLNKSLSLKDLRVLVVDDNEDNLLLASIILDEYAIEVTTAVSASEALKVLAQTKPDILICDIAMPGEDGYSLLRKIRELTPEQGGQIPAIALTAAARDEDRIRSKEAGFAIHITKPFEANALINAVAHLVVSLGKG